MYFRYIKYTIFCSPTQYSRIAFLTWIQMRDCLKVTSQQVSVSEAKHGFRNVTGFNRYLFVRSQCKNQMETFMQ